MVSDTLELLAGLIFCTSLSMILGPQKVPGFLATSIPCPNSTVQGRARPLKELAQVLALLMIHSRVSWPLGGSSSFKPTELLGTPFSGGSGEDPS